MKKVLSFVLVLSLVLGSFSMAFAATPTDVVGKDCEDAVQALSDLGVVSGYTDGTYKPENPVNRAEAAKLIISALGLDAYAAGITATSFTDLDGFGWAVGYIGYANQLGLVKGVGNNKFNPAGPVTYEQWATMLVRALGYTDEVLPGTWPANYMIKAQSLGILKNIKAVGNAAANRGDVAIMLYNNLDNPIGTINKDGDFKPNLGVNGGDDTMLARLEKAATANFGIFTNAALANVADEINLRSYLGASVRLYFDDKNDDGILQAGEDILGIKESESTFLTGDWDGTDTFTVGDVEYKVNNPDTDVPYFLNGVTNGDDDLVNLGDIDDLTLAVKVSGKTIKTVYSILDWQVTDAAQFDDDLDVDNCKLLGHKFHKDNNKEIDLTSFELVGVSSLDKIAKDNIVEVYVAGGEITKVTVGTTVVEGEITKANKDNDKFTINGTAYSTTAAIAITGTTYEDLKVGDSGKAYLNAYGKIAYFDVDDSTAGNYAVVENAYVETKGNENTAYLKLFTKEGKSVTYELDKVKLETKAGNRVFKDAANSPSALETNELIKFGVKSNGKIDSITTFAATDLVTGKANKPGTLIGDTPVKDSIVVFICDDDDWELGTIKDLGTDNNVQGAAMATIYSAMDGKKVAAIAVNKNIAGDDSTYGIVSDFAKKTVDGDKVWVVNGWNDGAEMNDISTGEENKPGFLRTTVWNDGLDEITIKGGEVDNVQTTNCSGMHKFIAVAGSSEAGFVGVTTVTGIDRTLNLLDIANGADKKSVGLDKDVVVYLYNDDDDEWSKGAVKDIKKEMEVQLYWTDEDDYSGYNIVLAKEL